MAITRVYPTGHAWPRTAYIRSFGSGQGGLGPTITIFAQRLRFRERAVIKTVKVGLSTIAGSMGNELELRVHPAISYTSGGTYSSFIYPDTTTTLAGPVTITPTASATNTFTLSTAYEVNPVVHPFIFLSFVNLNSTPATNYPRFDTIGGAEVNLPGSSSCVPA